MECCLVGDGEFVTSRGRLSLPGSSRHVICRPYRRPSPIQRSRRGQNGRPPRVPSGLLHEMDEHPAEVGVAGAVVGVAADVIQRGRGHDLVASGALGLAQRTRAAGSAPHRFEEPDAHHRPSFRPRCSRRRRRVRRRTKDEASEARKRAASAISSTAAVARRRRLSDRARPHGRDRRPPGPAYGCERSATSSRCA